MVNSGFILVLAYPETIVRVSKEWFSSCLPFFGIGKKNYVRAGHAALILINKTTGVLEYYDFGRYITPEPYGRVRNKKTDTELEFKMQAKIKNNVITNLDEILEFFATNPKITHGQGTLYASLCQSVNYNKAKTFVTAYQQKGFIRYAAFLKNASNCARFVTDTLLESVTDNVVKKKLIRSKKFTPSTIGNVVFAGLKSQVFKVSEVGRVTKFNTSIAKVNKQCFLDKLAHFQPDLKQTQRPIKMDFLLNNAQWLSGVGAGAWFELEATENKFEYVFRRISALGSVDINAVFKVNDVSFNINENYEILHDSKCEYCHVKQQERIYRFQKKEKSSVSLMQKVRLA